MMSRHSVLLVSVFFLLISPLTANAEKALDFTIHEEYTSTRGLGMGNAFTAVVDDHSTLFYNPAALARRTDGQLRFFLRAGLDQDVMSFADDISNAGSGGTEAEQAQEISDLINENAGKHLYMRVPTLGMMWVRPNWGMAVLPIDLSLDIVPNKSVGASLTLNAYADTTIAYGYGRDVDWLGKHKTSFGITGKLIHRISASTQVLATELASDDGEIFDMDDAGEGVTVDFDIGMLFTPVAPTEGFWSWMKRAKPTVAVVVRNVMDWGFPIDMNLISDDPSEPVKLHRRLDIGGKLDLPQLWVFEPKVAMDIRNIGHPNFTFRKGFHFGTEMYWKMYNWWKGHWSAGINQGYWSLGLGAKLAWFQLDIVSWGEEVGTSSEEKESRRFMVEMSLDF